jgi:simple sugar transport system ATP-binding protein
MEEIREPLLRMENINKSFSHVQALSGVTLELQHGEVLGLVGDNGAGKSTLIKILSGATLADEGRFFFDGKEVKIHNPGDARRLGIETIYQYFALVDNQPIYINLFMGRPRTKPMLGGLIQRLDKRRMEVESREILEGLKIRIPSMKEFVRNLSGGQKQAVAIGRAVFFNPKILVMDEPTSGLAVKEVDKIHEIIKDFKQKDVSVILITHRLQSIFDVCDRVIVLRAGKVVKNQPIHETSLEHVVKAMFGL